MKTSGKFESAPCVCVARSTRRAPIRAVQRGVTLIEVLVAVVVLSIGLLGLAGLQASGMRVSQSSLYRGQAAQLAYDMVDRLRANTAAARAGKYERALSAADETDTNKALADINDWMARVRILPGGRGGISVGANTAIATVTIKWDDRRGMDRDPIAQSEVDSQTCANTSLCFELQAQLWNNN